MLLHDLIHQEVERQMPRIARRCRVQIFALEDVAQDTEIALLAAAKAANELRQNLLRDDARRRIVYVALLNAARRALRKPTHGTVTLNTDVAANDGDTGQFSAIEVAEARALIAKVRTELLPDGDASFALDVLLSVDAKLNRQNRNRFTNGLPHLRKAVLRSLGDAVGADAAAEFKAAVRAIRQDLVIRRHTAGAIVLGQRQQFRRRNGPAAYDRAVRHLSFGARRVLEMFERGASASNVIDELAVNYCQDVFGLGWQGKVTKEERRCAQVEFLGLLRELRTAFFTSPS